jgi:phosphonoacetaldehyde hydrolase
MSRAPIEMVVFDWAGTTVDHGSLAPILAMERVFAAAGAQVSRNLLRLSMGLAKRDRIREVLALSLVREDWAATHHTEPGEGDVASLYAAFTPCMLGLIDASSLLIPGVIAVAEQLRARGIRVGSTTGYTRPMLDRLLTAAAPDLSLCPDDAPGGPALAMDVIPAGH